MKFFIAITDKTSTIHKKGQPMTAEEKQKWNKKFDRVSIGTALVIFVLASGYMAFDIVIPAHIEANRKRAAEEVKRSVIDNKVKQYEQTLLYYEEYLQTAEQIKQYRDSLQRSM